ncbi:MAG TPA: EAL domain-containing protein [Rhodanobacteraceae bacterium]|nr:EAL domain-containing protein [Rhodanobacteraceae bacterium]
MSAYRVELAQGETLFREGDAPTTAFLIESGEIEVGTHQGGTYRVLGVLGPGDLLGEMAVIDDSPRTASARTLTPTILTPIDRAQFAERLETADPVVRALLLSQLSRYRSALAQLAGTQRTPWRARTATAATSEAASGALDKIRLESQLREALERRELEVRLQPILDIATQRVAGYEALTRWTHPERGAISPAEFIALAEETSLIVPVGEYVLREVCAALSRLDGAGADRFIAVNVSGRQLGDDAFIRRLLDTLAEYRASPQRLKIEVTESLVLDYDQVARFIGHCRAAGMRVALDDFGTGYSNLGHLHRLHFDTIKLDQGFIRQMDDPRCLAIVRAIVGMAQSLECDMVAEGVETPEQLLQLRTLGCQFAQGWLVGKPLPMGEALALP